MSTGRSNPVAPPVSYLLQPLIASIVAASNGVTDFAAAGTPVQLNPFGTLSTLAAWLVLIALNAWCFRRILRRVPARAKNRLRS